MTHQSAWSRAWSFARPMFGTQSVAAFSFSAEAELQGAILERQDKEGNAGV